MRSCLGLGWHRRLPISGVFRTGGYPRNFGQWHLSPCPWGLCWEPLMGKGVKVGREYWVGGKEADETILSYKQRWKLMQFGFYTKNMVKMNSGTWFPTGSLLVSGATCFTKTSSLLVHRVLGPSQLTLYWVLQLEISCIPCIFDHIIHLTLIA